MRIVLVHPEFLHRGGAENLTVWLATGLLERGHEVTLAAAGIDRSRWPELAPGVALEELPDREDGLRQQPGRSRRHGRLLVPLLRSADLVVCGNYPSYWWVADAVRLFPETRPPTLLLCQEPPRRFYFRTTDAPIVEYLESGRRSLPLHEELADSVRNRMRRLRLSRVPFVRWFDRRAVKWMDAISANSEFSRRSIRGAWGREAEICGVGIPERGAMTGRPFEERSGVAVLTGFSLVKNPMGVLGAIDEVAHRLARPDVEFYLTGRTVPPALAEFIRERRLEGSVRFLGYVSEAEKADLLGRVRLCLFIPLAEPFGLVTIEAMLRGTPVIAANHGGPAEAIRHDETGLLVDPFDPAAVAQAVADLYDDRPRWTRMSERGPTAARDGYLLPAFLDRFEALAARLVAGKVPARGDHR